MAKSLRTKAINQIMYISIGCVIAAVILFITIYSVLNRKSDDKKVQIGEKSNQSNTIVEEASSSIGNKIEDSEEYVEVENDETMLVPTGMNEKSEILNISETTNSSEQIQQTEGQISNNEVLNESSIVDETQSTIENINVLEDTTKDPTFVMPVEGEIVKKYGKEKLIYSETLKEWTTHFGIDIKADKTTIVKSASDGCVKYIKNDPRYGLTVVIEHENGFTSVYSNLLTAEFIVAGENVKTGQTIGTVGNSATFEILEDPHLHFEILKDGNSIDPEMYIK